MKAAYVLNFVRYADWPADSFASAASPIVVGLAEPEVLDALTVLSQDETVRGRRIVLRRIELSPLAATGSDEERERLSRSLEGLHVLYAGDASSRRVEWLLSRLEDRPVLTVGDGPEFAAQGGMIGLVVRNRRLAFDANVERMRHCGVTMSSQVLRLARIVNGGGA